MTPFLRRVLWWRERRRKEQELREELQFHLAAEAAERQKSGLSASEAQREARLDLGNAQLVREDTRPLWSWVLFEQLAQDIRYGLRTMAASKTFSAMAIVSLALGIGANAAIFSAMDAILLRTLPVPEPQSLVLLSWHTPRRSMHGSNRHDNSYTDPQGGFVGGFFSYPAFEVLRQGSAVFSTVFGYQGAGNLNLTYRGTAGLVRSEYVSGEYFSGLGVPAAAGRLIGADDDRAGGPSIAVVSFGASQRFGGPDSAVGQSIRLNDTPFTIVGVAPRDFLGADPGSPPDVYVPMHTNLVLEPRDFTPATYLDAYEDWVVPMARLRPGVSPAQAQAALAGAFHQVEQAADPQTRSEDIPTLMVREGSGGLDGLRRAYSQPLYILLALVALVLSIACANIANLLLARGAARRREIAVRLSLGAGRFRIVRQLLTESVLLAAIGGTLGIAVAVWGGRLLAVSLANGRPNFDFGAQVDWRVLLVAAALSVLTGVIFGLVPALQSTRADVVPALKASRIGSVGRRGFGRVGVSQILMVSQIAFTLLILVTAGLFLRTLSNLTSIPLGFNGENVLTLQVNARQAGHSDPEIATFYNNLRRDFAGIPGVRSATLSNHALVGTGTSGTDVVVAGEPAGDGSSILMVGADFLATMQIPLLEGREINERDVRGTPLVAVVNAAFVKQRFGDRNAIGQHLRLPHSCPTCDIEIVGVVADTRYGDMKEAMPSTVYLSFAQEAWGPVQGMFYELRTSGDPLVLAPAVRALVQRADPRLPIAGLQTQRARIDQTISQEIAFARLCSAFALLALTIACVGLYGSLSYNVARRTGEIGLRMALGARRDRVLWMVLREVVLLASAAVLIGVPVALAASRFVASFLFAMKPTDPQALIGAVVVLVGAALVAGYLPARSAARIDPTIALRCD